MVTKVYKVHNKKSPPTQHLKLFQQLGGHKQRPAVQRSYGPCTCVVRWITLVSGVHSRSLVPLHALALALQGKKQAKQSLVKVL